jgi:hypothetical protein
MLKFASSSPHFRLDAVLPFRYSWQWVIARFGLYGASIVLAFFMVIAHSLRKPFRISIYKEMPHFTAFLAP